MDSKLNALSSLFGIDEEVLRKALEQGEDLYNFIAKEKRCSREEVKFWAHGVMYSMEPDRFKEVLKNG